MAEEKKDSRKFEAFFIYLIAAAGIRFALKLVNFLPSVEPITGLALLAAIKLGPWYGLGVGVLGYLVSNTLLMSNGPWTIMQAIGVGIPALWVGWNYFGKNVSTSKFVWIMIYSTIFFEIIVTAFYGENVGIFLDPAAFISAAPFSLFHLVSNVIIAILLAGMLQKAEAKEAGK
ncbi:MAG: hypothetical protein WC602_06550 [archaeon]